MRIRSVIAATVAFVVSGTGLLRPAFGQSIDLISAPVAGQHATAIGVSEDGTIVGGTTNGIGGSGAFLWTRSGGRQDFGAAQGYMGSATTGLSGDGTTLVGRAPAFRYRGAGTHQTLGTLGPYPNAWANGTNGDGNVIVGEAFNSSGTSGEAWRWTPTGGMQGLGRTNINHTYSNAQAVSRDGQTIVGWSGGGGANSEAFRWTQAGGLQPLPDPPGSLFGSEATAVNHDGSYIAGWSGGPQIWHHGVVARLPFIPFWDSMVPHGISDDGSIVAGQARNPSFEQEAWIWTQGRGSESLMSYLISQGVQVPAGWKFASVAGLSADGRTIVGGMITSAGGHGMGFVATVPTPGVCVTVCAALCATSRRRRANRSPLV
jgi:uncharacterized membrane protein